MRKKPGFWTTKMLEAELKEMYYYRKLSCVEIAKLKGCATRTVYYYMGKYGIPRRQKAEALKLKYEKQPKEPLLHPNLQMNGVLAYILGVLVGDGWVYKNKRNYGYVIGLAATSNEFVQSFANSLKAIGLHPTFSKKLYKKKNSKWKDQYVVQALSREFFSWYKNLTLRDLRDLFIRDEEYAKAFLKGFYESEGNLHRENGCYHLHMYNSDKKLVDLVEELLRKLGFSISITQDWRTSRKNKAVFVLRILGGTKEVVHFLSAVKPCFKNV